MLRVRTATFEDAAAIRDLNARNGMGETDIEVWRQNWEAHPFRAEFRDVPTGWVLEKDDGVIVGNLDNVRLLYEIAGRRIKGAVASCWAVDALYRGKSLQLMTAFLRQKGVDLCLINSASETTAQIMTAMKIPRIPIPDYGTPCFWAVRHRGFARAALARKQVPGAGFLAWPAGLALSAGDIWHRSGRGRIRPSVRRLTEFDDRFNELWQRISAASTRLRTIRTKGVLEWRFRIEKKEGRSAILVAEREGELAGYAVLVRRGGWGMDLYDIADLQAIGDDPSVITDLLLGSIDLAREDGADAVKFMTGLKVKFSAAKALHPYTYELRFWQLYYRASTELASLLSAPDVWDLSWVDTF
jgi:hypothetical protein